MEVTCYFEALFEFQQTTQRYVLEYRTLLMFQKDLSKYCLWTWQMMTWELLLADPPTGRISTAYLQSARAHIVSHMFM
jgi:hypothetical protein